jgi:hypothetical protein
MTRVASPAERIAAAVYDISEALADWCAEAHRPQHVGAGLPEAVATILGCDVSDVTPR